MSVVPLIFRDWWDEIERPVSRLMDQHFARGLDRDDLISRFSDLNLDRPARSIFANRYYRPWRNVTRQHSSGSSTIQIDGKDNFQGAITVEKASAAECTHSCRIPPPYEGVRSRGGGDSNENVILEVQQFSPEEITVKTTGNNVIVEARHEERQDEHGFVSRHFVRRYVLPPSHDVINVTSSLSSDGVLTITAPKKGEAPSGGERVIEIVRTGEPASKSVKVETITEQN